MSLSRMLNFKLAGLLDAMDDDATSNYNQVNQAAFMGNMTELKAFIGQIKDSNARFFNVLANTVAQR